MTTTRNHGGIDVLGCLGATEPARPRRCTPRMRSRAHWMTVVAGACAFCCVYPSLSSPLAAP
eukprot:6828867-Pyramimonas_sp.AAC.2